MTLQSAISALTPALYWPLSDVAGSTTVADLAGGGFPGSVTGDITLGVFGPELETTAARIFTGGVIQSPNFGTAGFGNFSVLAMISVPANGNTTSGGHVIAGWGDPTNPTLRGFTFVAISTAANSLQTRGLFSNTNASITGNQPLQNWHLWSFTYQASPTSFRIGFDNIQSTAVTVTPTGAPLATDRWFIQSSQPVVIAHLAVFTRALTTTEVLTVANQVQAWPYQIPINSPIPVDITDTSPPVTVDLTPVLTDTAQIKLNQSTYMPQISATQTVVNTIHDQLNGLISVTFPDLATVLNGITDAVSSTVVTAAGNVSRTIGQMLSGREGDTLTEFDFGTTCDTTPATYELGGGFFFRAQFVVTAMPDWYVLTGPGDTYITQSLGTIEFHRAGVLQKRIGLHTTTHHESPLPGLADVPLIGEFSVTPGDYQIVVYPAPGVCINTKAFHQP